MNIFSFFTKKKELERVPSHEFEQITRFFVDETKLPCCELTQVRKPLDAYDSKFGGVPYLPPGFAYPHNAGCDRKPLKLLAQLNFDRLPQLPDFPAGGMLQFYIACEEREDCFGVDFDNPTRQSGFRVIYHPRIAYDAQDLQNPPKLDAEGLANFPFAGEFGLEAMEKISVMTHSDFRYSKCIARHITGNAAVAELLAKTGESAIDDYLTDTYGATGHRIGGYPFFTQTDPREYAEHLQGHSILLLQIDSVGSGEDQIIWGDCGVANFFIRPDDLKRLDFSNVIYTWDCC